MLERTVLFGTILENVKAAYVDRDVDVDKLFQTGVNAMLGPSNSLGMALASMTSAAGRSFTVDQRADGFARSEGARAL